MRGRSWIALGVLLACALVAGLPAAAQDGRALWAKTYGGTASDNGSLVKDNGDGTYFISGTTRSTSATGADLLLMKVDSSGTILWQKTYGSTGDDYGGISETADGGFAVIFTGITTSAPLTIMKLDGSGEISWQKTYGTPSESYTMGQVLQGGGFLLAGSTFAFYPPPPSGTVRLMKLDASGNITWQKKYSSPTLLLQSIMAFPLDGGGYIANCNGMDMTAGTVTNLLLKLDGSGNITAQKAFSVPAGQIYGTVAPSADGGFLYVGSFNPAPEGDGKTDILLAKLNASGDIAWQKTYGGSLDESGYILPISGGFILSGSTRSYGGGETNSRALLAKLDASGNILWGKTYGGTQDDFLSAMADTTGGYLLQGGTLSFATGGTTYEDFWAVKVNESGDIQWQRAYGGNNEDDGYLERTSDGMLLTGDTKSVGFGDYDIWIWKLDSQGQLGSDCPLLHNTTATAATITLGTGTGTLEAGSSDVEASATTYTSGTGSMNKYAPSLGSKDACSGAQSLTATASANPTSGAAPLSVTFTGTATGGTPSYTFSWTFGDGATSTQQNPSHTYAAPGTFTVTLTVTDAAMATATDNHLNITVTGAGCTLTCDATVPPAGVVDVPVAFASSYSGSGCTGAPTFAWTFGDGGTSTSQNPSHTYATAGTFLWNLSVTLQGQTCTDSGTITITGGGGCTLTCTATVPTTGIVGSPIAFASTATASNCPGQVTYLWAFGDESMPSMEQNPSHTYAAAGTYEWTFMASAGIAAPCIKSGTITISGGNPCASDTSFPDWKAEYYNNTFFEDLVLTKNEPGAFIDHDWGSNGPYPGCVNDTHWSVKWTRTMSLFAPGYVKFSMGSDDGSELFVDGSADLFSGDMNHEQGFIRNDIFYYLSAGSHALHMNYWDFEGVAQALLEYASEEPPCTYSLAASATPATGAAPLTVNFAAEATQNSCTGVPRHRWIFDAGDIVEGEAQTRTFTSPGTYTWKLVTTVDTVVTYRTGTVTVTGGTGKPGDCNGDGTVSIGEVQKAINMFLGIAAVECGVDCNGDGSVSIGEVQKVINAFLGVSSSC